MFLRQQPLIIYLKLIFLFSYKISFFFKTTRQQQLRWLKVKDERSDNAHRTCAQSENQSARPD